MGKKTLLIVALFLIITPVLGIHTATAQVAPVSVQIASPMNGATVAGPDVTFTFMVAGLMLAPGEIGMPPVPGHGHMHIFLDGLFKGTVGTATFTLMGVAPGMHTVRVDLHENNHVPISPVVESSVMFTVV